MDFLLMTTGRLRWWDGMARAVGPSNGSAALSYEDKKVWAWLFTMNSSTVCVTWVFNVCDVIRTVWYRFMSK